MIFPTNFGDRRVKPEVNLLTLLEGQWNTTLRVAFHRFTSHYYLPANFDSSFTQLVQMLLIKITLIAASMTICFTHWQVGGLGWCPNCLHDSGPMLCSMPIVSSPDCVSHSHSYVFISVLFIWHQCDKSLSPYGPKSPWWRGWSFSSMESMATPINW